MAASRSGSHSAGQRVLRLAAVICGAWGLLITVLAVLGLAETRFAWHRALQIPDTIQYPLPARKLFTDEVPDSGEQGGGSGEARPPTLPVTVLEHGLQGNL